MKTQTPYQEAVTLAERAVGILGGGHSDAVKAIARVCEMAIQDGIWGALAYVPRPAELPDTDAELHDAATSKRGADKELKLAVLRWKWANESVEMENAERLRVCALNFADLDRLRDQGDETVRDTQVVLFVHCKRTFNVDVSQAPKWPDPTLERWCRRAVATKNPVPVWLRLGLQPRNAFRPRGGEMTKVGSLFGGGDS